MNKESSSFTKPISHVADASFAGIIESVNTGLSHHLVPDELWNLTHPLLPGFRQRPQGGGSAPINDRRAFTAVVYVLSSECPWRELPPWLGVSPPTAHRRFILWSQHRLWERLLQEAQSRRDPCIQLSWIRTISEAALRRSSTHAPDRWTGSDDSKA